MSDSEYRPVDRVQRKRRGMVVIAVVLVALFLIVSFVRATQYSPSPNTSGATLNGPPFAYSYTCCSDANFNAIYHPGERIAFHWSRSAGTPSRVRATSITLSMSLSGPYRTVFMLKNDSVGAHPRLGRTNASAVPIRVKDNILATPISLLQVPANAGSGYYDLTITSGTKSLTESGKTVIRVRRTGK